MNTPFSSCLQSFPASGSIQMSQSFASGGQSMGVSASVLSMNIQDWFSFRMDWFTYYLNWSNNEFHFQTSRGKKKKLFQSIWNHMARPGTFQKKANAQVKQLFELPCRFNHILHDRLRKLLTEGLQTILKPLCTNAFLRQLFCKAESAAYRFQQACFGSSEPDGYCVKTHQTSLYSFTIP